MFKNGIKLGPVIGLLVIMTVISTTIVNWYGATKALKSSLTENYLKSNYNYSKKLAQSTNDVLTNMQENIIAMSQLIGNIHFQQEDLDTWHKANSEYFNSVFITDENGVIQLLSPSVVQYKDGETVDIGTKITSDTVKKALSMKKAFTSAPYRATSGQLIMLVSAPIFDDAGNYQGLMGGTVYLESENILKKLFNEHEYADGSYVYVVDTYGRLIYHPETKRLHEVVKENKLVQELIHGKSGTMVTINTEGKEFLSGYTFEENTGWGIVSQTPSSVITQPAQELFEKMVIQSLPHLLLILLIAGILTKNISKPLNVLARYSEESMKGNKIEVDFQKMKIKTHIYEVRQLYQQINSHLNMLNNEIQMDGLTGIANRKTFDVLLKDWVDDHTPFFLIMIDIDHFKKVNDTYGHLLGDEVLKFLSSIMDRHCDESDICFRYGGEEFGILLKNYTSESAFGFAENLRKEVAETPAPIGEPITISIGMTSSKPSDHDPKEIIERADTALYQSKSNGRNKTTIYQERLPNRFLKEKLS